MMLSLTSWKTTAAGIAALAAAVADIAHQASTWTWDANSLGNDVMGIAAGIGLLFAKDHDKK